MNINYEFLYSGIPSGEENAITGLLIKDTDTSKTYILQIPLTGVTPSEGKIGPYDLTEVESNTLTMVNANTLFQSKSVDPMLEGQVVSADNGYVALTQVTVSGVPVETKTVKSNTEEDQIVTPSEGKLGISQVTVQKFDGESGNPEAGYPDGTELRITLPAKYKELVDKVPEFNGKYKAIVSDTNKTYANAQIVYADDSIGPRIPMFDLIGKVDILVIEN